MKAVLLAAGKGERLGTLTHQLPKPMIPIDGKPVIEWNVNLCKQNGITELFINLFHLPDIISNYLGNGERFGVTITYAREKNLLGTGGGVKQFARSLGDDPFFVIYSDNWADYDLETMYQHHKKTKAEMTIALFHLDEVQNSGIAVLDSEDQILEFLEKPAKNPPPSHWVNAGIYVMDSHLLSQIPNSPCDFGRDVIPGWIKANIRIMGIKMKERVIPIDTPDMLKVAKTRKK